MTTVTKKPQLRLAQVSNIIDLSPFLRRIIFTGKDLVGFPDDAQGAYVKVFLPNIGENTPNMNLTGPNTATKRSYTIRQFDRSRSELTLDFVINKHIGPATDWAKNAQLNDTVGIAGPGPLKMNNFHGQHYLLMGDMTSINAVNGIINRLPPQAHCQVIQIIDSEQDKQIIDKKNNVDICWVMANDPFAYHQLDLLLFEAVKKHTQIHSLTQVFMGLEASQVRTIKAYLLDETDVPLSAISATGYWKRGVNADDFGKQKNANPL
ncbi:siderophore-interacting protein [Shewanella sp. A14]|tara:strand:+ start:945 stop:1736 length:792 start_codon:yes stop_codon:yes gene_type:complete